MRRPSLHSRDSRCPLPSFMGLNWQSFGAHSEVQVRGPGVEEGVLGMCLEEGMEVEQELGTNNWSRRLLLLKRKEDNDSS